MRQTKTFDQKVNCYQLTMTLHMKMWKKIHPPCSSQIQIARRNGNSFSRLQLLCDLITGPHVNTKLNAILECQLHLRTRKKGKVDNCSRRRFHPSRIKHVAMSHVCYSCTSGLSSVSDLFALLVLALPYGWWLIVCLPK
jgi:hypothetical protein